MATRLTDVSVRNAKPGAARREIPDGGCKGLYLVIQPSGAKSWAVRYRHQGRPRKLTLDGFPSLATARKLATAAIENPDRDPAAEKQVLLSEKQEKDRPDRDLFPAVVETYMRHYAEGRATRKKSKPKPRTIIETQRILDKLVAPEVWGSKRIQDISKRDAIDLLDGIVDRGAMILANRTYAAISPLFAWAAKRDIIPVSPVIWDKAAEEARDRHFSPDEVRLFWQATEALGYPFRAVFRLLLLTGQRKSEVAAMVDSELDLDRRMWTIGADRTKNSRIHTVPMSDAVLAILTAVPRVRSVKGYLFTINGVNPSSGFTKPVEVVRAKMNELAGEMLPHWSLHDLRRTVATLMSDKLHVEPHVVEAILNHVSGSKAGVAGVYNHSKYPTQKTAALEAWGRYVDALVTGATGDNVVKMARG